MRKIFSFFIAILFASSMMAEVGSLYYTFLPYKPSSGAVSDYTKTGTMTIEGMNWTVPGNWYATGGLRLGGKSLDAVDRTIIAQNPMGSAISKIRIAHAGKTADAIVLNSIKVTTASDADFTQNVTEKTVTDFTIAKNTKDTIDIVPATEPWAANSYYKIAFNITNPNGSNYAFVVESIMFYAYAEGGGDDPQPTTRTIYLNGGGASLWNQADAVFFVHAWGGTGADVLMTQVEGDVYSASIPSDNTSIVFVRMAPGSEAIDWDTKWNQSTDQTIPSDKDLFTMTDWSNGTWSVYGETPEPPTPVEASYYLVGTMNEWTAAEAYKFAAAETEGEFILHTTLAENDEIKVIKVEGETTTWYPAEGGNYVVDALHAGEKDIYFRPAGNEAWAEFGGYIWMGENQPAPVADFTQPFTLKFNGTGTSGTDASGAFAADVAAIFDAASAPYVASVETATKIYAGRPIADDNSSVKFGTTSAQGSLSFTLAQAIEVDSIIVNATQYGTNAAKITVNGTEFDLTAGNKVPQDSKITPEGAISVITIAQSGTERIYLRNVRVYPKTQGGDTPVEIVLPVVKLAGSLTSWEEPVLMANAEDSLSASVTLNLGIDHYQLKVVSDDNWLSKAGDGDLYTMHRDWNHVDHLDLINTGDNIILITDVEGAYTFTWTYADSSLVVTFPEAPAKPNYYLIGDSAFVVDAGATADKAWTPDAIASFNDTTVLNLKAGVDYIMRLSLEGTWENHRDFRHLTDTAAGLIELPDEYQNRSIGFRLNEAGPVTIIYIPAAEEQPEVFKLIGDFYVAPAPDPTVSVFGSMTDPAWEVEVPFTLSDDKSYATLTVDNIGAGEYNFKFFVNGEWRSNGYRFHREFTGAANITENNDADMVFVADQDGQYTFTWFFANDSLAITYPEYIEPVYTLTNGYYLVGKFGGVDAWSVEDLSAEKLFAQNPDNNAEYQLPINLAEGDEIKVVEVENDAIKTWFPNEGENYVVDGNHAGATTMYFRPDYQGGEGWHAGCIFIVPTGTVDITNIDANAPAVKAIRNGQLFIIKGEKTYNAQGTLVK